MEHAKQTIQDLEAKLVCLNSEAKKIKNTINCLCEVMGQLPRYEDVEERAAKSSTTLPDAYYGRPLATVITEVLEHRREQSQGAATLDELFNELVVGGFKFTGKNDGIKKRGLSISMSKNPKFHRLPNDTWGLTEWYPNVKDGRETNKALKGIVNESTAEEENLLREDKS